MNAAEVDLEPVAVDLTEHEWDIPCGYSHHAGEHHAQWAVWFRPVPGCGHFETRFLFFCDPCWNHRSTRPAVRCNTCSAVIRPAMQTIVRVEAIS